jgi:hypothetical protein
MSSTKKYLQQLWLPVTTDPTRDAILDHPAHNGLVAGSSPAGPTILIIHQGSQTYIFVRQSSLIPFFL